ncbi:MAG: VOC family protein [Acidimicrobiia bacterium]
MIPVQRLNHAVLYVRDADRSAAFYQEVFGFEIVEQLPGAAFLRAAGTTNHHDLGLFSVGPNAPLPQRGRVGLYHLAWEVPSVHDLTAARDLLRRIGAYVGESDHGVSKSIYAHDPDRNEFEVMWAVPAAHWGDAAQHAVVAPLDLDAEVDRFG